MFQMLLRKLRVLAQLHKFVRALPNTLNSPDTVLCRDLPVAGAPLSLPLAQRSQVVPPVILPFIARH